MINKSFQLLRTNPLLTTNLKVVVTSDYNLYLESFNSNVELSNVKFKHYKMSKTDYLENKIPYFYKGLPVDLAFDVKYDSDNKTAQSDYSKQFDTTYISGAGYVEDQWYSEEFDYFAPLYIRKNNLPSGFVVLRVDDPSGYNLNASNTFEFESLNAEGFKDIIKNWKCVKFFDMSYETPLGEWLHTNFVNNERFPRTAFEYNPERAEFSYWHGIDYSSGIYTYKPIFMDDRDAIETPHFRWEKFLTEGYRQSGLIFPFILNFKFLFDDTPATPNSLRKYSINRYYGFYVDQMEYVGSITSYQTPPMISGTTLLNNIIITGSTEQTEEQRCKLEYLEVPSVNPFVEEWNDNKEYFIFIDNTFDFNRDKTVSGLYQVTRTFQNNQWIYKVISDEILDDFWNTGYTNIKTVNINYDNYNILSGLTSDFFIDRYTDCSEQTKYMYGDLYLINIDGKYHVIKYSSGLTESNDLTVNAITGAHNDWKFYIQTDYAINMNSEYLEYWILGKNSDYYRRYEVQPKGYIPITLPIFRVKFSDIKDFDFDRVNTQFSDFDYEMNSYTNTPEEKLFAYDYNDESIPREKRLGRKGYSGQGQISIISSEYIADDELYEVNDLGQQNTFSNLNNQETKIYELNEIWRKNQSIVKWGFMGSISHSDYAYKLNNNYEVGGPYNRTINPFYTIPDITEKNLDYFYRLGNFYRGDETQPYYFKNQTTNIQWDFISGQLGKGFDIEAYFGGKNGDLNFDYFTFFFKNKMYYTPFTDSFDNLYTKSYDKYAVFNFGDNINSSITLFKGLKFKIREINNIYTDDTGKIEKIIYGDKNYNDYKLSIILNENYNGVNKGVINSENYITTNKNVINIILNEKHKNVLIAINAKLGENITTLNDLISYKENYGLYYGKDVEGNAVVGYDPKDFVASNFINAINDLVGGYNFEVRYYYIKEDPIDGKMKFGQCQMSTSDGKSPSWETSTMDTIPDWQYLFTPFILNIELPTEMLLYNNCYTTYPFYVDSVYDDYVATLINFDDSRSEKTAIYRFGGPYEPIFKDINVFKNGFFCYNNINTGTTIITGTSIGYATQASEIGGILDEIGWDYLTQYEGSSNIEITVPYTSGYTANYGGSDVVDNEVKSKKLCIRGFNFSNIPFDADINVITLFISRNSLRYQEEIIYVKEKEIKLSKNCLLPSYENSSDNVAYTEESGYHIWRDEREVSYHGISNDLWNLNGLKGSDVLNPNFGLNITLGLRNLNEKKVPLTLPQVNKISMVLEYLYSGITYTAESSLYFDNNYKFDTELNDFGKVDELIYSKVNEKINPLSGAREIFNIYPSIDNFGYGVTDRFIFKSSWDKEFFIRTESKLNDTSGNV